MIEGDSLTELAAHYVRDLHYVVRVFFQKQLLLKQKRAFLVLRNTRSPSIKTSEDPVLKEKHTDEITQYTYKL